MVKVSILPGEYLWTKEGIHDLDDNGMTKVATEHIVLDINDDVVENVMKNIMRRRFTFETLYVDKVEKMYVVKPAQDHPCKFLEQVNGVLRFKNDYELNETCEYMFFDDIDWNNIPRKNKLVPKIENKKITVPIMKEIDEIVAERVFDAKFGKFIARQVRTGKKITVEACEILDLYDENNNYLDQMKHILTEEKFVEVEVLDENGHPVLEPEKDSEGNDVTVPIYPVKYLDDEFNETTYDLAVHEAYSLSCLKFKQEANA